MVLLAGLNSKMKPRKGADCGEEKYRQGERGGVGEMGKGLESLVPDIGA